MFVLEGYAINKWMTCHTVDDDNSVHECVFSTRKQAEAEMQEFVREFPSGQYRIIERE